ncbi:unnamed protein product [Trichogramma brassicae]|uniref:Uncharacterized protein n=1 Tax=Trichogramma brassicae TaxID=86971 RepID=A0A6H5I2I9_9HYME|nr:unnamed protein product [Trichogramma brassicae]
MCITMSQVGSSNTDEEHPSSQLDAVDKSGCTALHRAVSLNHDKVAELLLRKGANPNLADEDGQTPLHLICKRSHDDDFAKKFFEITDGNNQPVDIDAVENSGLTPLHWAMYNKHKNLAKLLLKRGANPYLVDEDGQTALHILCMHWDDDELAANLLLGTGAASNPDDESILWQGSNKVLTAVYHCSSKFSSWFEEYETKVLQILCYVLMLIIIYLLSLVINNKKNSIKI